MVVSNQYYGKKYPIFFYIIDFIIHNHHFFRLLHSVYDFSQFRTDFQLFWFWGRYQPLRSINFFLYDYLRYFNNCFRVSSRQDHKKMDSILWKCIIFNFFNSNNLYTTWISGLYYVFSFNFHQWSCFWSGYTINILTYR